MEAQEIFDKVVNHLRTQNSRSELENGACAYRGENGLSCAVGCLIPVDVYEPWMDHAMKDSEGVPLILLVRNKKFPQSLSWMIDHLPLLRPLQMVHDNQHYPADPHIWENMLLNTAEHLNLKYSPPTT